jgi:predicted transcriptional regulator
MSMITFTASEAKQHFGTLSDTALTEPVSITRRGRVILEVMTPKAKEAMIQERIKELVWGQFLQDAVESDKHYQETGLHTTFDEMEAWANSLGTSNPLPKPKCHI